MKLLTKIKRLPGFLLTYAASALGISLWLCLVIGTVRSCHDDLYAAMEFTPPERKLIEQIMLDLRQSEDRNFGMPRTTKEFKALSKAFATDNTDMRAVALLSRKLCSAALMQSVLATLSAEAQERD